MKKDVSLTKLSEQHRLKYLTIAFLFATLFTAPAFGQAPTENEMNIKQSLFYESYKHDDFENAIVHLRWILANAPTHRKSTFNRAIKTYDGLAKATADTDAALSRAYLDTAIVLYDTAIKVYDENEVEYDLFDWKFKKGYFIQSRGRQLRNLQNDVLGYYLEAYNINKTGLQPYFITFIAQEYARRDQKQGAIDFMDEAEANYPGDATINAAFTTIRDDLFSTPEERMEYVQSLLEKEPENTKHMGELLDIYRKLDMRDDMTAMGERLLETEVTEETAILIAKVRTDNGDYAGALELYETALGMMESSEAKRNALYAMAGIEMDRGRLSQSRTLARRAIAEDANFGRAYMLIGSLYQAAVVNAGSFEPEDQAVYWLVQDYYNKAKRLDPSQATSANNRLRSLREYVPSAEKCFFKGWKDGDRYTINYGPYAWINESTTVRVP